ncbi:MAG: flagellar biosynthesis protein FlhF [Planctomycetota bacterium]
MALKVYRARSMNDALAEVKRDLGADAVILHTRNYKTGGMFGFGARTIVEITATTDDNPPTRRPVQARRARVPLVADPKSEPTPEPALQTASAVPLDEPSDPLAGLLLDVAEPPKPAFTPPPRQHPTPQPEPRIMTVAPSKASPPAPTDDIQAIKRMVSKLLQTSAPQHAGAMSDPLFEHYLRLQENAVASEIADDIVGRVRDELSAAELADEEIVRETLLRHIAALLPVADDAPKKSRPADGRPRTVALIGPTGVGKTTTLAKLAATAKLRHGRRVGLITTDTYRIAAVEQLRTYADIIGLKLTVVASPAEMRPALESMADLDEILIDTAGRSQHDEERLSELRTYLDEADPHEIHLVLSSIASEAVLTRAVDNFAQLGPNRLIVTKLDEAVNFGVLLGVVQRLGVNLSYVTTGQEVPDHIEPGKPDRLARLILTGSLPS